MDARTILTGLSQRFPYPRPSPVWLDRIIEVLRAEGLPINLDTIIEQYLCHDLAHCTLPSSLLPDDPSAAHQVQLFPLPSVLQICSITEIGSSAFQLQTVLEQRKDIFEGASRIKRMDDEEPEDETEDDKVPAYPRGMLKLEVTDGERVMQAMEYRRIPELILGETSLGAKLLVQNVKALRNVLLLEPANTQVLGGTVDVLDQEQSTQFMNSLRTRLGKPALEDDHNAVPANPPLRPRPAITNGAPPAKPQAKPPVAGASARAAALAAALGPPQPPNQSPYFQQNAVAGPSRQTIVTPARPARNARTQAERSIQKLYDNYPPPEAHSAPTSRSVTKKPRISEVTDTYSDFDNFDDSFLNHVDEITTRASGTRRPAQPSSDWPEDDDEFGIIDDSVFHQVEEPSRQYLNGPGKAKPKRKAAASDESGEEKENRPRQAGGSLSGRSASKQWGDQRDVIELSSD